MNALKILTLAVLTLPLAACGLDALEGKPSETKLEVERRAALTMPVPVPVAVEPGVVAPAVVVPEPTAEAEVPEPVLAPAPAPIPAPVAIPEPVIFTPPKPECVVTFRVNRCKDGEPVDWYYE